MVRKGASLRVIQEALGHRPHNTASRYVSLAQELMHQQLAGLAQGDVGAGDGCRAGAAVGLEDVAVDGEGALAQEVEPGDRAQGAADEPLDLSWVRAPTRPRAASRGLRVRVGRGSMPYSAVTQPEPEPRRKGGSLSSTLRAQRTMVCPSSMRAEPSAWARYLGVMRTGRIWSGWRPSGRVVMARSPGGSIARRAGEMGTLKRLALRMMVALVLRVARACEARAGKGSAWPFQGAAARLRSPKSRQGGSQTK